MVKRRENNEELHIIGGHFLTSYNTEPGKDQPGFIFFFTERDIPVVPRVPALLSAASDLAQRGRHGSFPQPQVSVSPMLMATVKDIRGDKTIKDVHKQP